MAYHITHMNGAMESSPPRTVLPRLLDELAKADAEPRVIASHTRMPNLNASRKNKNSP
jgi:hypothetical protein